MTRFMEESTCRRPRSGPDDESNVTAGRLALPTTTAGSLIPLVPSSPAAGLSWPPPLLPNGHDVSQARLRNATRPTFSTVLSTGALVVVLLLAAGCGGSGDRSSQIAQEIGATGCLATDYQIINRLDGTKTRIYDCTLNGNEVCVTEQNGIANDVTETAKLLFASNLSGGKPSCAS